MRYSAAAIAGALVGAVNAENYLGFNTGSTHSDGSAKFEADYVTEFTQAKNLKNAPGDFNAFRLYTNIQPDTSGPIEAFSAAMKTKTKLLLGIWCSGVTDINSELSALEQAVNQYGTDFTDLVIGISIGSEDLYRDSATGRDNDSGIGNSPDAILGFINDFRKKFKGTSLSGIPVGHVETADVWPNGSVAEVISAVDFMGLNGFPYYENTRENDISNGANLFMDGVKKANAVAQGKPLWVTETGWPYVGPDWEQAVASVANAKTYWDDVGCDELFGKMPTFWYELVDDNTANTMQFAIADNGKPRFDLSCPKKDESSSTSSASSTMTKTQTNGGSTATPTGEISTGRYPTNGNNGTMTATKSTNHSATDSPTTTGGNSGSPSNTGASAPAPTGPSQTGGDSSSSSTPSPSAEPPNGAATLSLSGLALMGAVAAYFL